MKSLRTISAIFVTAVLATGWFFFRDARSAKATVSSTPCPGNVCTGTVTVGGQPVAYSYNEHLSTNGQLRIRLNGGTYNTTAIVSHIIHDLPQFASTGYANNVARGALAMTESDVNPGRTAYERRDANGCVNCIYDQVLSLQYAGLPAGSYSFSFTVIQYGDVGGLTSLPFYVDATAPSNTNESQPWSALAGMATPCSDGVDNDIDFSADCADAQCIGSIGQVSSGAKCEIPETTCNDEFDNNANGLTDCLDPSCNGRVGQPLGTALCQYGNEYGATSCVDGFDNDADTLPDCVDNTFDVASGGNSTTFCWKKTIYSCPDKEICSTGIDDDKDKRYDDAWDNDPGTGKNCRDYDCRNNSACPAREHQTATGLDADGQCFDGDDNDLDYLFDCADPDCRGVVNPADQDQICYDKEFDLGTVGVNGSRYQFCSNSFDDDGDVPIDCKDSDCARRFGNCGPCPSREDITYASCANAKDDDADASTVDVDDVVDSGQDCQDTDCNLKLGSTNNAALCGFENTYELCSDGFDNGGTTNIDCAESTCAGKTGPSGQICQPTGESGVAGCSDQADNDGDGKIDCVDSGCVNVASCADNSWVSASCVAVPSYAPYSTFTSNAPTIGVFAQSTVHVSSVDKLRFIGSGTYTSVTIIVGGNAVPTDNYPYSAPAPGCTLIDTQTLNPSLRFAFTAVPGAAIQIYNKSDPSDVPPFDITLSCPTPVTPAPIRAYPISLSAERTPSTPEYGVLEFTTTNYEATPPSISEIEPEGIFGTKVNVPYGNIVSSSRLRRFRAIPNDPAPTSGICRCDIEIDGVISTTDSNCITAGSTYTSDTTLAVRARAEDGAGNKGAFPGVAQSVVVNVTPVELTPLVINDPATPFFRSTENNVELDTFFITSTTDTFPGFSCRIYLHTDLNTSPASLISGPSFTVPMFNTGTNIVQCNGIAALPTLPADGRYSFSIKIPDSDGDIAQSSRKAIYFCDTIPGSSDPEPVNGCQYADFDHDGASEGLFTNAPGSVQYSATKYACDNCVGHSNASQEDANANGIGDECEPNDSFGRCEIDRDFVCDHKAVKPPATCPFGKTCCPSPAILDPDEDNQRCIDSWGICTLGGQFCLESPDCPGGQGRCQDADPGIPGSGTPCYLDTDCGDPIPGTPLCSGADRCENLLYPWVQTVYGNVFSGKRITALDTPPTDQYNASFCVTANSTIFKFTSESEASGGCANAPNAGVDYSLPKASNSYSSRLGEFDIVGLRNGRYGKVIQVTSGDLDATLDNYGNTAEARVYRVQGDATVSARSIRNGTVFVDGGNLTVLGNITYVNGLTSTPDQVASVGWIVLDNGDSSKGNVYIDASVTDFVGAIYASGTSGFWSIAPPDTVSDLPLTVEGLVMVKEFHLGRSYKSKERGSEKFIYDGRAIANPPPGFSDITRSLPTIGL